jgi:DNA-binding NtrC family response regulator/pSer/pThr/pTyr-binding forkhead associated (FHA) protein
MKRDERSDGPDEQLTATRSAASPGSRDGSRRSYLLVLEGGGSRMCHLPPNGTVLIGRVPEAELQLSDESVSRRHARITLAGGEASISDLESFNGTKVNGEKIAGARELHSGDVVAIGDVLLVLHRGARAPASQGLLSAANTRRRVAEELERAQAAGRSFSVATLRLLSPPADRAALERRLLGALRLVDAAGWLGEREIALIVPEQSAGQLRGLLDDLLDEIPEGRKTLAAGIATGPADGFDADTLLGASGAAAQAASPGAIRDAAESAIRLRMDERVILLADPAMLAVFELLKRLARSDLPVLIRGETGTGKENAAYAVHHFSTRSGKPFVAVNCAALAETLLESELFGHERGAFSGATQSKPGLLETASGGTVFLDEVGELSPSAQSKLLRALEVKRITRVGDVREREIDIRIVAATHRDLEDEIKRKQFRQDLFFRLGAATVILPPLRERPREIALLARAFLEQACSRVGRPSLPLTPPALQALVTHTWPGNVRELRNLMEFLAAAVVESSVELRHLPSALTGVAPPPPASVPPPAPSAPPGAADAGGSQPPPAPTFKPIAEEVRELEARRMAEALQVAGGVRKVAAELITMPLRTFTMKLKQYGLAGSRGAPEDSNEADG